MSEQSQVTDGNSLNPSIPETQASEAQTNASEGSQPAEQAMKSLLPREVPASKYNHIPNGKWKTDVWLNRKYCSVLRALLNPKHL